MNVDWLGLVHVLAAGTALGAGTAVAIARKGTVWHRRNGQVFALAMLVLNLSALGLYDLTGRVNLFHFFALASLFTVGMGVRAARLRFPDWRRSHAYWMLWAYVGLLAATTSEVLTRLPIARSSWTAFGITVGLASALTCLIGAVLIQRAVRSLR